MYSSPYKALYLSGCMSQPANNLKPGFWPGKKIRNMKVLRALSIALLVGVAVASASASNISMQFTGTGSNSYNGISSYPYSFTVDGTQNVALMCVSFNEHITGEETWQATKYTVAEYAKLNPLADELAYLYTAALRDGGKDSSINAAAWFLNEQSPANDNVNIQNWVTKAENAPAGPYNGISVYVPINGTQSWTDELPQTFYGGTPTPEPGTLLMLGSGIVGLAGVLRRKFIAYSVALDNSDCRTMAVHLSRI